MHARGRATSSTTVPIDGHRWTCWCVSTWVRRASSATLDLGGELATELVDVDAAGATRGRSCRHERGRCPEASTSVGSSRALSSGGSSPTAARWAPTPRSVLRQGTRPCDRRPGPRQHRRARDDARRRGRSRMARGHAFGQAVVVGVDDQEPAHRRRSSHARVEPPHAAGWLRHAAGASRRAAPRRSRTATTASTRPGCAGSSRRRTARCGSRGDLARASSSTSMNDPSLGELDVVEDTAPNELEGEVHVAHAQAERCLDQVVVDVGVDEAARALAGAVEAVRADDVGVVVRRSRTAFAVSRPGRTAGRRRCRGRGRRGPRRSRS